MKGKLIFVGFISLLLSGVYDSFAVGPSIEMGVDPDLPDAGKMTKLTFVGKTADGKVWEHIDYRIIVHKGEDEILRHEFHTHAGILDLEIIPESASEFTIEIREEEHAEHEEEGKEEEESEPPAETTVEKGEGQYLITGPLFLEEGDYKITAQIIGIEFNPLPPESVVSQEFSLQVVPEFPLAALIPMVFAFAAMISAMRFRNRFS
jgi:hypothetical protein